MYSDELLFRVAELEDGRPMGVGVPKICTLISLGKFPMPYEREDSPASEAASKRHEAIMAERESSASGKTAETIPGESTARIATRLNLLNPLDGLAVARVFGRDDFLPMHYLSSGLRAARPVGRIQVRDMLGHHQQFGTGFLISPGLMLTNHHVLSSDEAAMRSQIEFDVQEDENFIELPRKTFRLNPDRFFYASERLDFAIVAVAPRSSEGGLLADLGSLPLIEESGKALIDEPVTIIQHPEGGFKRIALRENKILGLVDDFIQYTTDTSISSSGAPVFNDQWQVVALHHRAVAQRNKKGQRLTVNHRIWTEMMDVGTIEWVANEGVRISSIVADLKSKSDWTPVERSLLAEAGIHVAPVVASVRVASAAEVARPAVRPITLDEFNRMVASPDTTEEEIAAYIQALPTGSDAFNPSFRANPNLVIDERGFESDQALNWANGWCRRRRQRAYRRKIAEGGDLIRIVSEGDSWFQYPFILDDVIDHLMAEPDLAVFSLDAGGDLLRDMISSGEYLTAIRDEQPSIFLISGGGNDMLADKQLAKRLHLYREGLAPDEYPNEEFDAFLKDMRKSMLEIFQSVRAISPTTHIFCHSYDFVIPWGGDWLGKPMRKNGIRDIVLQARIMGGVMNRVAAMLQEAATTVSGVTFLDLRGQVQPGEWYDELHPVSRGFRRVADVFLNAIRNLPR